MSRLSDLAGVLKGARKVAKAFAKQSERTAGDAWLQSSIREGVEKAIANKPRPDELGLNLINSIPQSVLGMRQRMEEMTEQVKDTGESSNNIQDSIETALTDIKSILKHVVGQKGSGAVTDSVPSTVPSFTSGDIVDDSTIEDLNVGSGSSGETTPPSSPPSLSSIISVVTNYQDVITKLEKEANNLNDTIDTILNQISDLQAAPDFTVDVSEDIENLNVGESTGKDEVIEEKAATTVLNDDIEEIISKLRLDITTLQDDAAVLQDSAAQVSAQVSEIMGHVSSGDLEAAAQVITEQLAPDLESAIESAAFGSYPTDNPLHEESTEADAEVSPDEGSPTVTQGNYTDPFSPRSYSTLACTRRYSTTAGRAHPAARWHSAHQKYLVRLASSGRDTKILVDKAASYVGEEEKLPEKKSLASYTASKRSGSKRKSLDERAKRRAIPDTQIKRALAFGGLAASIGMGTISEMVKRSISDPTNEQKQSALLSDENIEKIVSKLCEMRGAALKIGQMVSIQDETLISPEFAKIMARVRDNADFMPASQFETQMSNNLGSNWQEKFGDFEIIPFAAASLGQVHYATLLDGTRVVVKVQYPGVADSINSDIDNLTTLLKVVDLVPKGAHIDQALMIAKKELAYETDYIREADCQEEMRELMVGDVDFDVPRVIRELSTKHVLTQEFVQGDPIDSFTDAPVELRNSIALKMLKLCLRELFEFQFMQTDPNWSNFFYDPESNRIKLLDFGATLRLSEEFSENYLQVIRSCATDDRDAIIDASIKMGFLSGYESELMIDAHCEAIKVVGEPFATDEGYDFVEKAAYKRVGKLLEVFAKHRITAPPEESYALNRKLSGAFLLCTKLNAVIPCKPLFDKVYQHKTGRTVNDG